MERRRMIALGAGVALAGGLVGGTVATLVWHAVDSGGSCDVREVAGDVLPSVVTVTVTRGDEVNTGSGVVLDDDGAYVVSNDHVTAASRRGATVSITYADGHTSTATVVGGDPVTDLSVLVADDLEDHAEPVELGDSGEVRVGQPVVALGAPLGLSSTVTAGIVSATGRTVQVPTAEGGTTFLVGSIQTDASINPGNSGGALVDCRGRLVGVNTAGTTPEGDTGSVGLNFAVPVSLMTPVAAELIDTGRVSHPTLGLQGRGVQDGRASGLFVQVAAPPAAAAGIRVGDIVTEIDGDVVRTADDLTRIEMSLEVGADVEVDYLRGGESATATVTVASTD